MNVFDHNDPSLGDYLKNLTNVNVEGSYYLMLLVGPYRKGKTRFLDNLGYDLGVEIARKDLREIVTLNEEETYRNIDRMLESLTEEEKVIWLTHGDRLCGAYTGYTLSSVRYATPQERYLLRKIQRIQKILILDINETHNVDKTLERYAHSMVQFYEPASTLGRLGWYLSRIRLHGNQLTNKRPDMSL